MLHHKRKRQNANEGAETAPLLHQDTATAVVEMIASSPTEKPQYALPIGIDDFKELRSTSIDDPPYWFADKSLFIQDIARPGAKISLITRPRRFGKTLNMSMLEYFFNIDNAEENRKLFEGLAITKYLNAMQHQGQYPVISISLKAIGAGISEQLLAGFKTYMSKIYKRHYYLVDEEKGKLIPEEKTFFHNVCSETIEVPHLEASLEQLIGFVAKHHNRKVMVLIDEYDHPLLSAIHGGFEKAFRTFYRNFIGQALKDNKAVFKGVLTGIVQIAGAGLFSEFNNPSIYHILDNHHMEHFGFTEQEVRKLLHDFNPKKEDCFDEISEWYNGYLFGEKAITIYNPWSVLQYVENDASPRAYWAYTSDNQLLQKELYGANDATKEHFMRLMQPNGKIIVDLKTHLRFAEMGVSKEQSLWVLLLSSGYLKAQFIGLHGAKYRVELSIPNKEIQFVYAEIFEDWLKDRIAEVNQDDESLLTLLKSGQIAPFCQTLKQFFLASVSLHDVRRDNIETFYHGFILALLGLMNTTHIGILRSNQETGLGRSDITFEPRDKENDVGIVMELKRLGVSRNKRQKKSTIKNLLKKSAQEGFEQITDRAYSQDLIDRGVQRIGWISLAFSGKQMAYQYREAAPVAQLETVTVIKPRPSKRPKLAIAESASNQPYGDKKNIFASRSPFFSSNRRQPTDTHWYTDDEINKLLQHYLHGIHAVATMDAISLTQHAGGTLAHNLQQLENHLAQLEAFAGVITPTIVLPINLGNQHWAALYIHHHDITGDRTGPTIGYFDPLGNLMPRQLKNLLKKRYPSSLEKDFLESPIQLQDDGHNCGPWVVEILRELIHSQRLPPEGFDIQSARLRHQAIVQQSRLPTTQAH